MELFYYCMKAPKDEYNAQSPYVPQDPINYDDGSLVGSDTEERADKQPDPQSYAELNGSLKELELDASYPEGEDERALSPVNEEPDKVPQVEVEHAEPEYSNNLMKRNNSRKFKTPSFKWKKKKKSPERKEREAEPYSVPSAPSPRAPHREPLDITDNSNLDIAPPPELEDPQMLSEDSLYQDRSQTEEDPSEQVISQQVDDMPHEAEPYLPRIQEMEAVLHKLHMENAALKEALSLAEQERMAVAHGNYSEIEKVRAEYQAKIDELEELPHKLQDTEMKYNEALASKVLLEHQVNDQNETINQLQEKIDSLSEQIGKLKDKISPVAAKPVKPKPESPEQQPSAPLLEVDGEKPTSPSTTDNNASEEDKGKEDESESETSTSSEEVDWSEMLKSAEANRARLGLDDVVQSDDESETDEHGNRVKVKKATPNGISTYDMINRMAANELMGYDEFGRPMGKGSYTGNPLLGGKKGHKNRSLLFGVDARKTRVKSNRAMGEGARSKDRRSGGGRRSKGGKGGNMALLGF